MPSSVAAAVGAGASGDAGLRGSRWARVIVEQQSARAQHATARRRRGGVIPRIVQIALGGGKKGADRSAVAVKRPAALVGETPLRRRVSSSTCGDRRSGPLTARGAGGPRAVRRTRA